MADVVDIPEFRAFYYTDDTPRQFYTLRRYEDESGSGKMHCYNIAPGIQLSFNDLNLSSCYQPLNVQKDFLEINYCLEGGHEVEMVGGGITFLGEKDLSISGLYHDKRVIVNSRIPFKIYGLAVAELLTKMLEPQQRPPNVMSLLIVYRKAMTRISGKTEVNYPVASASAFLLPVPC